MKKKIKAAKKIPNKWGEGPTVSEPYQSLSQEDLGKLGILKWRMKGEIIDAPTQHRIYKPPPHDTFLAYLEFRMNQKPTLIERIFGKRMLS